MHIHEYRVYNKAATKRTSQSGSKSRNECNGQYSLRRDSHIHGKWYVDILHRLLLASNCLKKKLLKEKKVGTQKSRNIAVEQKIEVSF